MFELKDYICVKKIIGTIFGEILFSVHNKTFERFVIKYSNIDKVEKFINEKQMENPYMEYKVLRFIKDKQNHIGYDNIVHLQHFWYSNVNLYFVFEYTPHGDLFNLLEKEGKLETDKVQNYFKHLSNAVLFLHNNDICHRDISLENCLIFENDILKLTDFGQSCVNDKFEVTNKPPGKDDYLPPEILNGIIYDGKQIDIWSLGVIMITMTVNRMLPINKIKVKKCIEIYNFDSYFTLSQMDLLKNILRFNTKKRFTIKQIIEHDYFDECSL